MKRKLIIFTRLFINRLNHQFLLLLIIGALSIPASVIAQVLNVESVRSDVDSARTWAGEVKFDVSLDKNRETVLNLGNEANAAYFSRRHTYLLLNSIDFVSVDSEDVVSKGFFHLRGTFFSRDKWSPELFVQYQYNQNLGLQDRAVGGGGMRYTFLKRPGISGHINSGIMFEHENWNTPEQQEVSNSFVKSTSNIVMRGNLTDEVSLLMIGYYQARPDRFFTPRVISENSLNFRMSANLVFTFNFTLAYDADPVIDIPNVTFQLKNGILILI